MSYRRLEVEAAFTRSDDTEHERLCFYEHLYKSFNNNSPNLRHFSLCENLCCNAQHGRWPEREANNSAVETYTVEPPRKRPEAIGQLLGTC